MTTATATRKPRKPLSPVTPDVLLLHYNLAVGNGSLLIEAPSTRWSA
jgi:hypothetical protein